MPIPAASGHGSDYKPSSQPKAFFVNSTIQNFLAILILSPLFSDASSGVHLQAVDHTEMRIPKLHDPSLCVEDVDKDEDDDDDMDDSTALVGLFASRVSKSSRTVGAGGSSANKDPLAPADVDIESMRPAVPEDSEEWEAQFAWGNYYSMVSVADEEGRPAGGWVLDSGSTGGVPKLMLQAEKLLASAERAPSGKPSRDKGAERALRIYQHAKWLAEHGFAGPAEVRYREAAALAKSSRRTVLAAHALSRLGYYLIYWNRRDEARQVLAESEKMSTKSNPLAPYLYGVLEREAAGDDISRLEAAEKRILEAGEQPSDELQAEREELVASIEFWRGATEGPGNCFSSSNAAHVLICLLGHVAFTGRLFPRAFRW